MNNDLAIYQKQVEVLEKQLKTYRVKAPHKPPTETKFTAKIDSITDETIFKFTLDDISTELYNLKRSLVSTTASEKLRKMFMNFTNEHLEVFKTFYEFGKLKGWTDIAPAFKTQPTKHEPVSVSETNHI